MPADIDDLLKTLSTCTERFTTLSLTDASQCGRLGAVRVRQIAIHSAALSSIQAGINTISSSLDAPGFARGSILERLPPKVLGLVLRYLPLRQRIVATQTCRAIRLFALTTPSLWTSVKAGPSSQRRYSTGTLAKNWTSLTGALSVISRSLSSDLPTRAFVSFTASCLQDSSSIACLQDILRCVTAIRLEPYSQGSVGVGNHLMTLEQDAVAAMSAFEWSSVAVSLCTSAPLLEFLEISVPQGSCVSLSYASDDRVIPADVLLGEPGRLRTCHLDGFRIDRVPGAFSFLTTFDYQPSPSSLSWADVVHIMDQMPLLQTLGLCGLFPKEPPSPALLSGSSRTAPCHHNLLKVSLAFVERNRDGLFLPPLYSHDATHVVSFFKDACSRSDLAIIVDFRRTDTYLGELPPFPPHVHIAHPRRILADNNASIVQDGHVTHMGNATPSLDGLVTFATNSVGSPASRDLSSLVYLTISEMQWADFSRLSITVPRLKAVCISILRCSYGETDLRNVENIFGFDQHSVTAPTLDCPALETFTISFSTRSDGWGQGTRRCQYEWIHHAYLHGDSSFRCACRNGGVLSFTEVYALLMNSIRLPAPLRELRLMGVRATADADPVAAFLLVTSIAEDVLVSDDVEQEVQWLEVLRKHRYAGDTQFWAPSHSFDPLRKSTFSLDDDDFYHIGPLPSSS